MGASSKVGEDERVSTFRNDNIRIGFSEAINKTQNLLSFAARVYCESLTIIMFDLERAYLILKGSDFPGFPCLDFKSDFSESRQLVVNCLSRVFQVPLSFFSF